MPYQRAVCPALLPVSSRVDHELEAVKNECQLLHKYLQAAYLMQGTGKLGLGTGGAEVSPRSRAVTEAQERLRGQVWGVPANLMSPSQTACPPWVS